MHHGRIATSDRLAAVDIGGSHGRVVIGRAGPASIAIESIRSFDNLPRREHDGLHSDATALAASAVTTLARATKESGDRIVSVGFDTWSGDYARLAAGRMLAEPFSQRESRTADAVRATLARVPAARLFAATGTHEAPFLTLFQLVADRHAGLLAHADRILLLPDLFAYWFSGVEAAERTNASTTGLLDWRTRDWHRGVLADAGIPAALLAPVVDAGIVLGPVSARLGERCGLDASTVVTTVASHDTASAMVAMPTTEHDIGFISSGSWSLVGIELESPVVTDDARLAGFTNEAGVDGTVRFLHISAGLWLLRECLREWGIVDAAEADALFERAGREPSVGCIDTTDAAWLTPGGMPERLARAAEFLGLEPPSSREALVRLVIESLARGFARRLRTAEKLTGRRLREVHLVGGGSRNSLLCQLTADYSGLPVLAGPVEATAIGNLAIQARAHGLIGGDLEALRSVVRSSFPPVRYLPEIAGMSG